MSTVKKEAVEEEELKEKEYHEWPHWQGGFLAFRRWQGRFPAEAAPIYTVHGGAGEHGTKA